MPRSHPALIALIPMLSGLVACCTPERCQPEALPFQGVASVESELFAIAQYAAREECNDTLYTLLSAASHDEIAEWEWDFFWAGIDIPDYPYELGDVVRDGLYQASTEGLKPGESFIYVEYEAPAEPDEPRQPNLFARILVVREPDPESDDPTPKLKVGLIEQIKKIEAGDIGYYWDAAR